MTTQFQNRLVGTIILVALGVIIIPDILDGKKTRVEEQFNAIPFAPTIDSLPPLLIELPGEHSTLEPSEELGLDADPAVVAESSQDAIQPEPDLEATPQVTLEKPAYVVQLGTFKNAQNVVRLVSKLRDAGFQAHSYPEPAIEGELNRVFVGPNVSKQTLEQQQVKLKALTGLSGTIRQFDPLFK